MKMNEPIADTIYAPLFLRLTLGGYFILAGFAKIDNLNGFIEIVKQFNIMSHHTATLYGILLPYVEIAAGVMLILGMWTTLAAVATALMLASFIWVFGVFPGKNDIFNKDIILFAAALSLMYSGAGAFSVDHYKTSGASS